MRSFLCVLTCAATLLSAAELSGRRAPGFSLPDMTMKQYDPQDYRGKILVIELMQTTCQHCEKFSEILQEAANKYGGRVAILSVVNPPDNATTVKKYIDEHKISVPILFDCGQMAASYLKVGPQNPNFNIPHVFLIDAQGMIRNDYGYSPLTQGIFEGRELFTEIDRMLGKAK
jgi:peroxiredoxin